MTGKGHLSTISINFRYPYLGDNRKLEAISFFKNNIEPTWEFGENGKGGQFFTTISRDNKDFVNSIYNNLLIQLALERFSLSNTVRRLITLDFRSSVCRKNKLKQGRVSCEN